MRERGRPGRCSAPASSRSSSYGRRASGDRTAGARRRCGSDLRAAATCEQQRPIDRRLPSQDAAPCRADRAALGETNQSREERQTMAQRRTGRTRPPGETSGSAQRPAQRLAGPVLTFDLAAESERLRQERSYQAGDRNAKTLVKEPNVRIVLTAMKGGSRLVQHRAAGPVSVQTVTGHVRLHVPGGSADLPAGHLLALEPDVPHTMSRRSRRACSCSRSPGPRGSERGGRHGPARAARGRWLVPRHAAREPARRAPNQGSRTLAAAARLADSSQASGSAIRSGVRPVRT